MTTTIETPRPTLQEEAERLLSYWEAHGTNPETVAKWAVEDMMGLLRYIVEDDAPATTEKRKDGTP